MGIATEIDNTLAAIFDRAADIMDEVATARALLRGQRLASDDLVPIGYLYKSNAAPEPIFAKGGGGDE